MNFRSPLQTLVTRICRVKAIRRVTKPELLVFVSIGVYTVLFSYITVTKYFGLETHAYDLGNYNQAIFTTLFNGKMLYYTADIVANPTGSLLGVHFSPLFFAIVPIYAVNPNPATLLILQTVALSLGSLPIFYLSKKRIGEKWALVLSILYLANPFVQGVNWYDFHPESFLPVFILLAFYFFEKKNLAMYTLSVFLTLMTLEFASVLLIFMSIYLMIKGKIWRNGPTDLKTKFLFFTIVVSLIWFAMSVQVIRAYNPLTQPMSGDILWREIGARNILDVPVQAVSHPEKLLNALSFDAPQKTAYCLFLFGTIAFLPLLEPAMFVCIFPWLTIASLSNYPAFYQIGVQYPALIIPFLFLGAILGVEKLKTIFANNFLKRWRRVVPVTLLACSIVLTCFSSPLNSAPHLSYPFLSYGFPQITQHDQNVLGLLQLLPPDASVLTQDSLFPPLSNRLEAYVFPSSVFYPEDTTFTEELRNLIDKVEFVVVDLSSDVIAAPILIKYLSEDGGFGIYASVDGALVLKRNYSNAAIFSPFKRRINPESFVLHNGTAIRDSDEDAIVFAHPKSSRPSDFWYGPYMVLPPGKYQVVFSLKIDNLAGGEVIQLLVSRFTNAIDIEYLGTNTTGYHLKFNLKTIGNDILATRTVAATEFAERNQYYGFAIDFLVREMAVYEFRGSTPTSESDVFFGGVSLMQIEPSNDLDLQVRDLSPSL